MPGKVNPAEDGVVVPEPEPMIYRPIFWAGTHGLGELPRYAGWGGAQADATPYGLRLAVAGAVYETGIGVLANSRIEVRNAGFARFDAMVGVDDSARGRSQPVTFLVYGDGKLLARSQPMQFGQAPAALTAAVKGVGLIEIVARSSGPRGQSFPVVWGDAALTK
jgi:hypothetical protein